MSLEQGESKVLESPDSMIVDEPKEKYILKEPFGFLTTKFARSTLLILNQDLQGIAVEHIWSHTVFHVCADGGANRLYNYFGDNEIARQQHIPQFIIGDLDSLRNEVKRYYEAKGTIVIKQHTQYATDFDKALSLSSIYFKDEKSRKYLYEAYKTMDEENEIVEYAKSIVDEDPILTYVVGAIGGRFDQTIGSMYQLYKLNESHRYIDLYFITNCDIIFLLQKGINYIKYDSKATWNSHDKVPVCGLLPLGNKVVTLNTWGLKYDVRNWQTQMMTQVSISNGISGDTGVIVEASSPIVMNIVTKEP